MVGVGDIYVGVGRVCSILYRQKPARGSYIISYYW